MGRTGSNGRKVAKGRESSFVSRASHASNPSNASQASRGTRLKPLKTGASEADVQFVIPSDFAAGREVQKRILDEVTGCGYAADCSFAIKLALEEAMINAIKHGNKFDPQKKVFIEATITPEQTQITIEDQGPGFDRGGVPDPTLEENLQKCSGRGILLMEAYMDGVEFSLGGRRVQMVKKNVLHPLPQH